MGIQSAKMRKKIKYTWTDGLTFIRQGKFIYIALFNTRQFKVLYKNINNFKGNNSAAETYYKMAFKNSH